MKKRWVRIMGAVAIMAGFCWQAALAGNPNPTTHVAWSKPYGMTITDWTMKWWQWAFSTPIDNNPLVDQTGASAALNQSGPVWFVAGTSGGPAERTFTIPTGKSVLFPIVNYLNDYPCPDPAFKPEPGQTLEEFLQAGTEWYLAHLKEMKVVLDGVELQGLWSYRFTSGLFTFTGDPSLTALDPCVTGTPQSGVADGYWIMLTPLSAGQHTLQIYGKSVFTMAEDGFDWVFEVNVLDHIVVKGK